MPNTFVSKILILITSILGVLWGWSVYRLFKGLQRFGEKIARFK